MVKTAFAFGKKQLFVSVSVRYFIILYHNKMTYGYKGNHQPEICHAGCVFGQVAAMPDGSFLSQRLPRAGKWQVEKDIFFIKKGIVRAYTSVDGKDITFWVGKEGATLVSMKGYVNDEPGYETMELMEDSVLYVLERKKLKELFSEDLHIANWGRRYAEMELLATEERLISMLSAIASERYKELLEKEPDLLQRLPLGSIATYLGVTQASLSRIRAQIK